MVDRVALRFSRTIALALVLCVGVSVVGSAVRLENEYKIWCDCNGDGIADVVKTVQLGIFETPESACPDCCCSLLRFEKIPLALDPFPFDFPDVGVDNPVAIEVPLPSAPSTAVVNSLYVPYTDSGEALIDARIRIAGGTEWFLQKEIVVDTGASITMFPKAVAVALGLDLKAGDEVTLVGVSGSEMSAWVHWIEIQFIGPGGEALEPIEVRAAFPDNNEVPSLLGRRDVLQKIEVVFQDEGFEISMK
jgi:hypothetical protein